MILNQAQHLDKRSGILQVFVSFYFVFRVDTNFEKIRNIEIWGREKVEYKYLLKNYYRIRLLKTFCLFDPHDNAIAIGCILQKRKLRLREIK